jgi:purine-binding chemotaxis protein CheW
MGMLKKTMEEKRTTDLIIDELKKRKEKAQTVEIEEEQVEVVIFTLRDSMYACPGVDVKEILPFMDISVVPGAPNFIPGLINNRGDIESVINLNLFLGLPDSARTAATRIAMISKAGVRSGIIMDSVLDVVDVPVSSIKTPLSTLDDAKKELIVGEMTYLGGSVVILNTGRLLGKLCQHGK